MSLLAHAEQCLAKQNSFRALNAFISIPDPKKLHELVRLADERRSNGSSKSPIDGKLIAIKDNICTADSLTTCASNILEGFVSPFSATVVTKLEEAGAVISGKTNLDEFGMGSHSTNSIYGSVINCHDRSSGLSAGGSSGGSAVAVASGQCWAALGTDTGGSVRLPAAYTGIIGFKPSYGLVSRHGVVAYANSLDTIGVLASKTQIAKEIFDIIKGYDSKDPTSTSNATRTRIEHMLRQIPRSRLIFGIPLEYNIAELDPPVRASWLAVVRSLHQMGYVVKSVSLPATKLALPAYYVIAPAEASSNLAKYDGVRYGKGGASAHDTDVLYASARGNGLGSEVKRRILMGAYTLSASAVDNYFIKAQQIRRLVQQDFDTVFRVPNALQRNPRTTFKNRDEDLGVDILLCPTAPSLPPKLADLADRPLTESYRDDGLTVPASLAGLPAISVPVPIDGSQDEKDAASFGSVGLQMIAQYGDDDILFSACGHLEEALGLAT